MYMCVSACVYQCASHPLNMLYALKFACVPWQALMMFEMASDALALNRTALPVTKREQKIIEKSYEACAQRCTQVPVKEDNAQGV